MQRNNDPNAKNPFDPMLNPPNYYGPLPSSGLGFVLIAMILGACGPGLLFAGVLAFMFLGENQEAIENVLREAIDNTLSIIVHLFPFLILAVMVLFCLTIIIIGIRGNRRSKYRPPRYFYADT